MSIWEVTKSDWDFWEEWCASLFPNLKPGKPSQIVDWLTAQYGKAVSSMRAATYFPLLQLLRKRSVHWKRSTPYRLFLLNVSVCKRSKRLVTFNTKRWNHCWLVILFDRWFGYCNPDLSTRASICRLSVISSSIGLWLFNSILENNFFNSILENNFTWNHDYSSFLSWLVSLFIILLITTNRVHFPEVLSPFHNSWPHSIPTSNVHLKLLNSGKTLRKKA